jgi:hypothetical protein
MDKLAAIKFIINGITGNKECLPDYTKDLDTQFLEFTVKALIENDHRKLNVFLNLDNDSVVGSSVVQEYDAACENMFLLDSNRILDLMSDPEYAYPKFFTQLHLNNVPIKSDQHLYKVLRTCVCLYRHECSDVLHTLGSGKYLNQNALDVFNILNTITSDIRTLIDLSLEHGYSVSVYELIDNDSDYDRYVVWPTCNNMRMVEQNGKGYLYSMDKNSEIFDFRNFGKEVFRHSVPAKYKEVQRYFLSEILTLLSY